jgi:hypothetical protein
MTPTESLGTVGVSDLSVSEQWKMVMLDARVTEADEMLDRPSQMDGTRSVVLLFRATMVFVVFSVTSECGCGIPRVAELIVPYVCG